MIVRATLSLLLALPQATYQETIEVRLHNVDVVVTDKDGAPVKGLRREDFEIREDGAVQTITNFAAYESTAPPLTVAPQTPAKVETTIVDDMTPVAPPPRTFVFFIDEMALDVNTLRNTSDELSKFVTTAMRPNDVAMVVQPQQVTNLTLAFTSDREAIRTQLMDVLSANRLTAQPVGFENDIYYFEREIKDMHDSAEARVIAHRYSQRATQRVRQRLGTLRALIASLAPYDGRKVLVAVTQNLHAQPGKQYYERFVERERTIKIWQNAKPKLQGSDDPFEREPAVDATPLNSLMDSTDRMKTGMSDLRGEFTELARLASTNGVTLYAIRPENDMPLRAISSNMAENGANSANFMPPDIGLYTTLQDAIGNTDLAVKPLVDITGGRQFRPNQVDVAAAQISNDLSNYYSLAYRGSGGLDKPHKLEVRVKNHPELDVRSRNEVVRKSASGELTDLVAAALVTPPNETENALGISIQEAERSSGLLSQQIVLEVRIPMASLDFQRDGKVYRAKYTAHFAAAGTVMDYTSGVQKEEVIEVPVDEWASARTKHWTHVITVARRPEQRYRVAVGIMDSRSHNSGVAMINISKRGE